jgi:hypothetical protein
VAGAYQQEIGLIEAGRFEYSKCLQFLTPMAEFVHIE